MNAPELTLFVDSAWTSPYAFSCFVALREKGLAFELREVALDAGEQRAPEYRQRTITGRVPALLHQGFGLAESSAIVEYLEETFPAPRYARVLPEDRRERARARQVMAWIRSDLLALRQERPTTTIFVAPTTEPMSLAAREAAAKLVDVAEMLVGDGRPNLGSAWSVADADLALMLHRLLSNGDPVPEVLAAYARAQWARPSVRGFVEHPRTPVEAA